MGQYFTLFQLFLLQQLKYVTAKDSKRHPNAFQASKTRYAIKQGHLKSPDKVQELETKFIGQCHN